MEKERWKDIDGYEEKYRISSKGEVFSLLRNRTLKTRKWGNSEYKIVGLYKDRKCHQITIHRLVALNFLGKPKIISSERIEVNHKNGIKTDNRVENLEWCTHGRNQSHAYRTGLRPNFDGENHPRAKFNNNFVKQRLNLHRLSLLLYRYFF